MAREGNDASLTDHVTQKLEGSDCKGTLGGVDCEAVLLQHLEKLPQVLQVLFHGGAGDEVIVQVREDEGKMTEATVHEALEGLGFGVLEHVHIDCPGMRFGQNRDARVDYESVVLFQG